MKLVIQVPCYNEEATLPVTLAQLPKFLPGVDTIETLVIDDGSRDATAAEARRLGAGRVLVFGSHRGLAAAFSAGIRESLDMGADVVVNTDADNQYRASDIPALIRPVLEGQADIVVGDRRNGRNPNFPFWKRTIQKYGSALFSLLAGVRVPDATSGFRAFSREAAGRLHIQTEYSYTLESLIHLGHLGFRILSVPVGTNAPLRSSRLIRNNFVYIANQVGTMFRAFRIYEPRRLSYVFGPLLALPGAAGIVFGLTGRTAAGGNGPVTAVSTALLIGGILVSGAGLMSGRLGAARERRARAFPIVRSKRHGDKAESRGEDRDR